MDTRNIIQGKMECKINKVNLKDYFYKYIEFVYKNEHGDLIFIIDDNLMRVTVENNNIEIYKCTPEELEGKNNENR